MLDELRRLPSEYFRENIYVTFQDDEIALRSLELLNVERLLWGASGLASPARYESFGLNVLEALCTGLPVVVTRTAGAPERVPASMEELLLDAPPDAAGLAERLRRWRAGLARLSLAAREAAGPLRAHTWEEMSRQLVARLDG